MGDQAPQLLISIGGSVVAMGVLAWKTRRRPERALILASMATYVLVLVTLLRVAVGGPDETRDATRGLFLLCALGAIPWMALASVIQSGRSWPALRGQGAFVAAMSAVGIALATLWRSDLVFTDIVRADGHTSILLGIGGRLVIVYLTAVAAYVLTQVEMLLRASLRIDDRGPRLGVTLAGLTIMVYVYVSTEAFLFGRLWVPSLITATVPATVTWIVGAAIGLRRSLDDMRVPLGRGVVYSSFTLFVLGLMMIFLGLFARAAEAAGLGVGRTFAAVVATIGVVTAIALWISPAWKRRVAMFIDENFYANRHDYRREWQRVARSVRPTPDRRYMVEEIGGTVSEIFDTGGVYVAILNRTVQRHHVHDASGALVPGFTIAADGELADLLLERRDVLVISERTSDLDLIAPLMENDADLSRTGIEVIVPMISGDTLCGMLLLTAAKSGAPYSPEDLSLMSVIGAELANTVHGHLLLREVEERRDGETLMKLSAFVLHDLKNCVTAIRGLGESAEEHLDDPEFRRDLVASLAATGDRMGALMDRLGQVRSASRPWPSRKTDSIVLDDVVSQAMEEAADALAETSVVHHVDRAWRVNGDREQLVQVFVNLVRNASDAMRGTDRRLRLVSRAVDDGMVAVDVIDTGCGMTDEFIAESLFRPFATTKSRGLGIGLYQCKNIVDDHGGRIQVRSEAGSGTCVSVHLPAVREGRLACETVS